MCRQLPCNLIRPEVKILREDTRVNLAALAGVILPVQPPLHWNGEGLVTIFFSPSSLLGQQACRRLSR